MLLAALNFGTKILVAMHGTKPSKYGISSSELDSAHRLAVLTVYVLKMGAQAHLKAESSSRNLATLLIQKNLHTT